MRTIDGQPACDFTEPWLTQLRGLASYTVPKIDVLLSTVFRSQPNAQPADLPAGRDELRRPAGSGRGLR